MRSGVREGSVVSLLLFSLYIDDLLKILRSAGYGCCLGYLYTSCLLFVDDIVITSISETTTVNVICVSLILNGVGFSVYCEKSNFMVIGKDYELLLPDMTLIGGILSWVKEIKYLSVFLKSKKGLRINLEFLQRCGHLS